MLRYIPVGVLEQLPQRINERPPYYCGRDDLETLMASSNCQDWVRIRWAGPHLFWHLTCESFFLLSLSLSSEMLLGPVPANFQFVPKYKSNVYS